MIETTLGISAVAGDEIVYAILAIDANLDVFEQQAAEWRKLGVAMRRAGSMREAISIIKQTNSEEYLFIAINEDSIQDCLPKLRLLRDVTESRIFVISSTFDSSKKAYVIQCGANSYDQFGKSARENVRIAYEILKRQYRDERHGKKLPVLVEGDIIMSPPRRRVWVNDAPLDLMKTEFDVLEYFLYNRDIVLSHAQIYERVWGCAYDDEGHKQVWKQVHYLRRHLEKAAGLQDYIVTVKDIGYRFSVPQIEF